MPKTQEVINRRETNDFYQAAGLLLDPNLEWSSDFELIRKNLGGLIKRMADQGKISDFDLYCIVKNLIREENDITIGN